MMYVRFYLGGNTSRTFTFSGARTGDAAADFLLGAFDQLDVRFGLGDSAPIAWKHQWFVQDEFKINSRLTLNYGVRYEPFFPWKQRFGRYLSVKPGVKSTLKPDSPPGILFPGDPGIPGEDRGKRYEQLRAALWFRLGHVRQRQDQHARRLRLLL